MLGPAASARAGFRARRGELCCSAWGVGMRGDIHRAEPETVEIDGLLCPGPDKNVRRRFGRACKALWDDKADQAIADIGQVDSRTVRRWFRGEQIPPWPVIRAVIDRMFEPVD